MVKIDPTCIPLGVLVTLNAEVSNKVSLTPGSAHNSNANLDPDKRALVISMGGMHSACTIGIQHTIKMLFILTFLCIIGSVRGSGYLPPYASWLCGDTALYTELYIDTTSEAITEGAIAFTTEDGVYLARYPDFDVEVVSTYRNCSGVRLSITDQVFEVFYECVQLGSVKHLYPNLPIFLLSVSSPLSTCDPPTGFVFVFDEPNCKLENGWLIIKDGELIFVYDAQTQQQAVFSPIVAERVYIVPGKTMLTVSSDAILGIATCNTTRTLYVPPAPVYNSERADVETFYPCPVEQCLIGESGALNGSLVFPLPSPVTSHVSVDIRKSHIQLNLPWTKVRTQVAKQDEEILAVTEYFTNATTLIKDYFLGNTSGVFWYRNTTTRNDTVFEWIDPFGSFNRTIWREYNESGSWTALDVLDYWALPHQVFFPQVLAPTYRWSFEHTNVSRLTWLNTLAVDYGNTSNVTLGVASRGNVSLNQGDVVYTTGPLVRGVSWCPYDEFEFHVSPESSTTVEICLTNELNHTVIGSVRLGESLVFTHIYTNVYMPVYGQAGVLYRCAQAYCYEANSTDASKYDLNETFVFWDQLLVIQVLNPIYTTSTRLELDEGQGPTVFTWTGYADAYDVRAPYAIELVQSYPRVSLLSGGRIRYEASSPTYFNAVQGQSRPGIPPFDTFMLRIYPEGQPSLALQNVTMSVIVNHVPTPPGIEVIGSTSVRLNQGTAYAPLIQIVDYDYDLELVDVDLRVTSPATLFLRGTSPLDYSPYITGECSDLVEFPSCAVLKLQGYPTELNVLIRNLTFLSLFAGKITLDASVVSNRTSITFRIIDPAVGDTEESLLYNSIFSGALYTGIVLTIVGAFSVLVWGTFFNGTRTKTE